MKYFLSKPKNHLRPTMGGICKEIYRMLLTRVKQNNIIYYSIKPKLKLS
jgi:hypothetical protein